MKKISTLLTALFTVISLMAQSSQDFWKDINVSTALSITNSKTYLPADNARALQLDYAAMRSHLKAAPLEFTEAAKNAPLPLNLPTAEGTMATFAIYEISIMEPGLAAAFPMIKTYAGRHIEHKEVHVRITTGPLGFHSTIFQKGGAEVIESVAVGETAKYICYNLNNAIDAGPVNCGNHDNVNEEESIEPLSHDEEVEFNTKASVPVELRVYRLALATTAEYSAQNGGTTTTVLNAVTSVMNQVNAILENDHALRLELIDNTENTFFFPPANNDPYPNGDLPGMLQVNPTVLNNEYGVDAYDVGHVFGRATGGGTVGLAQLGSTCNNDIKARGGSNVLGPNFYHTVVHEFGHQFNATHTFNLCDNENENPSTGYEPGGGSTLMAYAGACGSNSIQQFPDDYFHINSMERVKAFLMSTITGGSCGQGIATTNNTPEASIAIAGGFIIPIETPFELFGEATDTEGDNLTYNWEQYDLGPASPLGMPSVTGTPPLFRSYPPNNDPARIFPRIQNLVSNTSQVTEVLPFTSRDLTFRFTARDNNSEAGGYDYKEITFKSTAAAGPFEVIAPNNGTESWEVGKYMEVTWDVANTDGSQVNCQLVDIYLSRDGGFTYPITLLENTKNDGSAFVVVPDEVTSTARVKVKGHGNIFFDISNANFSIVEATAPDFTVSSYGPECGEVCVPSSYTVELETAAILGFSEMITFAAPNLPAGVTVSFSNNPVAPGESTTATFDFTNDAVDGDAEVTIVAEATGADNEERIVQINVVNSDFSALALNNPIGSAISTLPDYDWNDLPNGLSYNIEVATDAAFTNIIDSATDLYNPNYQSSVTLEEGTVYYWRVAASNECGTGDFGDVAAFKTIAQACNITSVTNAVNIPNPNGSIVQSTVNLAVGGEISDVNVKNINGIYNAFGDIVFRLIGPGANTVQLMNQEPCGNPGAFNFGFDGQAVLIDIPCPPPSSGALYRPVESLDIFNGLDAAGDWTLEIEVVTNFGAGGSINSWDLEICGAAAPVDPEVITNELICARPNTETVVPSDYLEITDADNAPSEITMTIVSNTSNGFLSVGGNQIGVDGTFTMADIYASALTYTHDGGGSTTDQFSFIAEDPTGGFIGLIVANFEVNDDCVVDARESLIDGNKLAVYPNPATDVLNVELIDENLNIDYVSIFNAQGQLVFERELAGHIGKVQFNIGHLNTGIYLVQVKTEDGMAMKKIVIE